MLESAVGIGCCWPWFDAQERPGNRAELQATATQVCAFSGRAARVLGADATLATSRCDILAGALRGLIEAGPTTTIRSEHGERSPTTHWTPPDVDGAPPGGGLGMPGGGVVTVQRKSSRTVLLIERMFDTVVVVDATGVREAVERLVGTVVSVADHTELAEVSRSVARLQAFVDLAKVQISRRSRELAEQGERDSAFVLLDEARCTGVDARSTAGRDRVCSQMPGFETALASGEVTGAHLDAVAQQSRSLSDAERADLADRAADLVAAAVSQPVALFERCVRDVVAGIQHRHRAGSDAEELDRQRRQSSVKRWTDQTTGMKHTMLALDPVRDASMWAVIDAETRRLCRDDANAKRPYAELQVEGFLVSVTGTSSTGAGVGRIPEIVVHVDAASLCHGRHDDTLCETVDGVALPVSTVQRFCCEALVQAVVVNPDGTVDRICAEQRTANRQQRRMLAAMYPTCAHPHCRVGFSQCRIHHVIWWTNGGRTVLANLLPLCEQHHHLVHEGGWQLSIDTARTVTWTKPDGTIWAEQPLAVSHRQRPPPRAA